MTHPVTIHGKTIHSDGDWRDQLRDAITSVDALLAEVGLRPDDLDACEAACAGFPLKVPRSFVARMRRGDPGDPLLLQVVAGARELLAQPGFDADPVGEQGPANAQPGLIHKYDGRVLLIVSSGCAVNCRYCFRRHFPYTDNRNSRDEWRAALDYIRADTSIAEVILSGGDPLVVGDAQLAELTAQIAAIDHVRRLRVHSRLPVVIPDRVTPALLDAITPRGLQTVMVIHCNHANEVDAGVRRAVAALRERGITVLNQAVLLADVNDSATAQVALSEALFAAGVLPYYLHLLDRVAGAAHFEVCETRAQSLHAQMAARLPGYLVPKLVREVAGADAKVVVPASRQPASLTGGRTRLSHTPNRAE